LKRLGFAKKSQPDATETKSTKKNFNNRRKDSNKSNLSDDDRFVSMEFVVPHDLSGSQELTIYLISDGYLGLDQQYTFNYCAY